VAEFLEERTRTVGQASEALAHHWREAGENERAVEHLVAAAEQAGRGWAMERAMSLYGEALELVPEDEESRRAIRMKRAVTVQTFIHAVDAERMRPD
jgi:hypothetical protein